MTDTERHTALLAELEREAKTTVHMSRQEARAYEDQAGGDYGFADQMVARLEGIRTQARNDAASFVAAMPFDGDFAAFVEAALKGLAERSDRATHSDRIGIAAVVQTIQRP